MLRLFRWSIRFLALALVLALIAAGIVYYLASRSLPDYNATYRVRGLDAELEIVRDTNAIPHIFGTTDADTLYGLGFVHAQDRLWQMVLMRRTAQGRLSELFGPDTLPIDEFMRSLDIYTISQRAVTHQTTETIEALEAYSAGVNAYIELVRTEALGRGAPEFFISSKQIAPWLPADSIALVKLMALQLTGQASREVQRARMSLVLPEERLNDLYPEPHNPVMALPEFASLFPDLPTQFAALTTDRHPLDPVPAFDMVGASNAWAAMGLRSASGGTLLATDPHLPLTAPSQFMLARLEFSDGGVIGATIPGIPGILIGRNADVGWGLTTAYLDDQDVVIEQLNPQNPLEYRTEDGFEPFETKDILIEIKDQTAVARQLRWSRHGPVIPLHRYNLASVTPPGHVATLQWTALEEQDRSIEAALTLMRSHSVAEALTAIGNYTAPSQNLILADGQDIAMVASGKIPLRHPNHPTQGMMPAPGWDPDVEWEGYFPYESNPLVVNPTSGIVANTNNQIVDAPFPEHFSYDWGDTQRIRRATALLNQRQYHTLTSFIEIQTDPVSIAARTLLPLMARDIWWTGQPAATDTRERRKQEVLELLANWNGEMGEHDPEPLVYAAWVQALQRRIIVDELGNLSTEFTRINPDFIERAFRNIDGAAAWCDIQQTTLVETCKDMSELALDEALLMLEEDYGLTPTRWRWGAAHQAVHSSAVIGRIPILGWFANIRQETPGGDFTLLRGLTRGTGEAPFTNVHGSGFRGVFDFADPDSSVMIISTGQSGHFLSRYYDDLSLLWRRGEYIPMSLDPDRARGGAVGITTLLPQ